MTNNQIQELFAELNGIASQEKAIAERKAYIKAKLASAIPADMTRAGVYHSIRAGSSVSWSKAAKQIITDLVPKTKVKDAALIVGEHTKATEAHMFKASIHPA